MAIDEITVTIPPVRAFARVEADKAHALKPLEEAAEVYGVWQTWDEAVRYGDDLHCNHLKKCLVDECCDVIQATCNLLAALGVTDLTEAMAACERRNRERGRYGDR